MTTKSGLTECYEAFERLKNGKPNVGKFVGITPDKITASIVSQEAGFDSGYLKKNRTNHQGIIALIDSFREEQKKTSLSKSEIIRRENIKSNNYKNQLERVQLLLEQSLARELLLSIKLDELERQMSNSDNVIRVVRNK